jgi:hypothetical protein
VRISEPTGAPPAGFSPALATLEDAYLVLMQEGASHAPQPAGVGA